MSNQAKFYAIPSEWLTFLVKENGTSYLLAAMILSEIKFRYNKKSDGSNYFYGDSLRISYNELSEHLGQPKSAIKSAVAFLEGMGLIKKEFRTVQINGVMVSNVMYVSLDEELLSSLTAEECSLKDSGEVCEFFDRPMRESTDNSVNDKNNINNIYTLSVTIPGDLTDRQTESDNVFVESVSSIEERIDADGIKADNPSCSDNVDSIVNLIRTIESDKALSNEDRQKVLSLKRAHIEAVIEGYRDRRKGKVRSPERYLKACLINSFNTAGFSFETNETKAIHKNADFPERRYDYDELERRLLSRSM